MDSGTGGSGNGGARPRDAFRLSAAELGMPETVTCPFCGGNDTELHSPFGPQLSVATYWCRPCRSPVEWIKWQSRAQRSGASRTS